MSPLQTLPHILTAALSTYALHLSYNNISHLRTYEAQSEKAAEWSNTAADRLHRTRATQASATVALVLSLLTSATLVFRPSFAITSIPSISLVVAACLGAAWVHSGRFWNEKEQTRIPFLEKFNRAIRGSERVVGVLGWLACVWGVLGVGAWCGLL